MKCFIPAAGFGTRMLDLTQNTPKPLLKLGNYVLLDYSILLAEKLGITEFIVNTHYLAEQIHEYLEKYRLKFKINISHEKEEILGTGGGIKTALQRFSIKDEHLLVINPDMLFLPAKDSDSTEDLLSNFPNYDEAVLNALKKEIHSFKSECLLYLSTMTEKDDYTSLNLKNGKVHFVEGNYFYIGLSIIHTSILKEVPVDRFYDLANKFRLLAKENRLRGKLFPGKVIDVGDKQKYQELLPYFKKE